MSADQKRVMWTIDTTEEKIEEVLDWLGDAEIVEDSEQVNELYALLDGGEGHDPATTRMITASKDRIERLLAWLRGVDKSSAEADELYAMLLFSRGEDAIDWPSARMELN